MQTTPALRLCLKLALLASISLCGHPLLAQSQQALSGPGSGPVQGDLPDPVYTTEHLEGVVLSTLDGKAVPRVLVTSPDQRMAAITDAAGRFSFDFRRLVTQSTANVFSSYPPDPIAAPTTISIRFHIVRPGYVGSDVNVRVPAIQPDTPEPTLQLKIVPSATLTGHLDPDSGDLPPDTSVQLARKSVSNGTATWGYFNTQLNSRGEFRFANLPPGDYKLLAPAYDPQFKLKEPLPDSIPGFRASFYPNAASFDSAAIIHLRPGEASRADLIYRSATFYNVIIPVTGLPDGKGFFANLLPDVPGVAVSRDAQRNAAQGYLPNGSFNIQLTSAEDSTSAGPRQTTNLRFLMSPIDNQFSTASIASAHLQIDGKPVRTQPVAFHTAFEAPIEIRFEFTNGPVPQVDPQHPNPLAMVDIEAIGAVGLNPIAVMRPPGSIAQNLSEGLFRVSANSMSGGYVASITSGSTDLMREPLRILPGVAPRPIEVTIRDDPASIDARLAPAANLLPQATAEQRVSIVCIPLDRPEAQAQTMSVPQDEFAIKGLAPGRYLVLASRQPANQSTQPGGGFEYRNEDVVRDLIPKGTVVTLSSGQQASVQVPVIPEGAD